MSSRRQVLSVVRESAITKSYYKFHCWHCNSLHSPRFRRHPIVFPYFRPYPKPHRLTLSTWLLTPAEVLRSQAGWNRTIGSSWSRLARILTDSIKESSINFAACQEASTTKVTKAHIHWENLVRLLIRLRLDRCILQRCIESPRSWIECLLSMTGTLIGTARTGQLGDWNCWGCWKSSVISRSSSWVMVKGTVGAWHLTFWWVLVLKMYRWILLLQLPRF